MKNSIKRFDAKNQNAIANFQNVVLTKTEIKKVKGGADPVVIEDIIII